MPLLYVLAMMMKVVFWWWWSAKKGDMEHMLARVLARFDYLFGLVEIYGFTVIQWNTDIQIWLKSKAGLLFLKLNSIKINNDDWIDQITQQNKTVSYNKSFSHKNCYKALTWELLASSDQ